MNLTKMVLKIRILKLSNTLIDKYYISIVVNLSFVARESDFLNIALLKFNSHAICKEAVTVQNTNFMSVSAARF